MGVKKYYETSCDMCGKVINHYPYRPSRNDLRQDKAYMKYNNGYIKIICEECSIKEIL